LADDRVTVRRADPFQRVGDAACECRSVSTEVPAADSPVTRSPQNGSSRNCGDERIRIPVSNAQRRFAPRGSEIRRFGAASVEGARESRRPTGIQTRTVGLVRSDAVRRYLLRFCVLNNAKKKRYALTGTLQARRPRFRTCRDSLTDAIRHQTGVEFGRRVW
jgi:hypothetical protein